MDLTFLTAFSPLLLRQWCGQVSGPYLAASKAALLEFFEFLRIFLYACADSFYLFFVER